MNWLFDWLWKRRNPRAALAGGREIPLTAMTSEEGTGESSDDESSSRHKPHPSGHASSRHEPHPSGEDDTDEGEEGTAETSPEQEEEQDDDQEEDQDEEREDGSAIVSRVHHAVTPGALPRELHYLDELIRYRIDQVLHPGVHKREPPMPSLDRWQLPIGQFIIDYNKANPKLTDDDARLLLIALVDHIQPDLFDYSINGSLKGEGEFQLIGGTRGKNFRGFIPTGQTAVFLLGGPNWEHDLTYQKLFWADHVFAKNKIIWLGDVEQGEPALSGRIILSQDYVDILVHNKVIAPHHNINFPAKLISTTRERDELVINEQLNSDFDHVLDWVTHKKAVETRWADGKKGFRCLFHGPSGTGKTFATCMLGKVTGREVYRIDLSLVVSKFIGETEKNLELIFARAENKDWILFFDEADALFGKRTNIRDAHDKYANQEASYLLQRIEDYDGLVVLATNMKNNIDDSFLRRFDSDLKFSMPGMEDRRKIWKNSFPKGAKFAAEPKKAAPATTPAAPMAKKQFYRYVHRRDTEETAPATLSAQPDIADLVKGYSLSGGNIQNVVHYATIRATKRQAEKAVTEANPPLTIYLEDVETGIKRELSKNGIPFTNKRLHTWDNPQQD